jgi:hypothetical protein
MLLFSTPLPHYSQASISILNTRKRRWAQVIAKDGMYAGITGAKTSDSGMALRGGFDLVADLSRPYGT